MRLYGGRPFALDEHLTRLARSAANLRLPIDLDAVRADVERCSSATTAGRRALRVVVTRGGHRLGDRRGAQAAARDARAGHVEYAPTRVLDGVKSLSYGANMLATPPGQGAGRRRGAARDAARPRARGPDVVVLLLAGRRDARHAAARRPHPRLDHAPAPARRRRGDRAGRSPRDELRARARGVPGLDAARGAPGARDRRRRAAGGARAAHAGGRERGSARTSSSELGVSA